MTSCYRGGQNVPKLDNSHQHLCNCKERPTSRSGACIGRGGRTRPTAAQSRYCDRDYLNGDHHDKMLSSSLSSRTLHNCRYHINPQFWYKTGNFHFLLECEHGSELTVQNRNSATVRIGAGPWVKAFRVVVRIRHAFAVVRLPQAFCSAKRGRRIDARQIKFIIKRILFEF